MNSTKTTPREVESVSEGSYVVLSGSKVFVEHPEYGSSYMSNGGESYARRLSEELGVPVVHWAPEREAEAPRPLVVRARFRPGREPEYSVGYEGGPRLLRVSFASALKSARSIESGSERVHFGGAAEFPASASLKMARAS